MGLSVFFTFKTEIFIISTLKEAFVSNFYQFYINLANNPINMMPIPLKINFPLLLFLFFFFFSLSLSLSLSYPFILLARMNLKTIPTPPHHFSLESKPKGDASF